MIWVVFVIVSFNFLGILWCQEMLSRVEKKLSYIEYLLNKKGGVQE